MLSRPPLDHGALVVPQLSQTRFAVSDVDEATRDPRTSLFERERWSRRSRTAVATMGVFQAFAPVGDPSVGSQDNAAEFVAAADDVEQVTGRSAAHR
jgi:hypothetical protein